MRRMPFSALYAAAVFVSAVCLVQTASLAQLPSVAKPAVEAYGRLPLSFEANQGQADPEVRFLSRGNGYSLFLTGTEAVLALTRPEQAGTAPDAADVIRMKLSGSTPAPRVSAEDPLPGTANYFIGNDPATWRTDAPTYARVRYEDVYPGVDLVYYGNQRQLEYDFAVAPGAGARSIRLQFEGARSLALNASGDLIVSTARGEIAFHKPVLYQVRNGQRQPVQGEFALFRNHAVGFSLGRYDHSRPLVIDPVLVYSTYLGAPGSPESNGGQGTQIAVDAEGNAYVVGVTSLTDFPTTTGALQSKVKGNQIPENGLYSFVTKIDPTGSKLIYSTYLGGTYDDLLQGDTINSIFVDKAGNAYLAGAAYSLDFPVTPGAFQSVNNDSNEFFSGPNGFVAKLNPTGTKLIYSTYIGGSGADDFGDVCNQVAVNSSGNAYVTGYTHSPDFPVTPGAVQSTPTPYAKLTAFVTEFNTTGTGLVYSTYLGGSGSEGGNAIAVDSKGDAYVAGITSSTDFPVTKIAFEPINEAEVSESQATGFVAKLNPEGSALFYATYLGGSGGNAQSFIDDQIRAADAPASLAIDAAGDAYITGITGSPDFPVHDAVQSVNKSNFNAFVTKLNPAGHALVFSTYLGSTHGEAMPSGTGSVALDASGDAYVTGTTLGWNFPVTKNAFQSKNRTTFYSNGTPEDASANAFVSELSSAGKLLYSTYLGGSGTEPSQYIYGFYGDSGSSVALDKSGNLYVTGIAEAYDFPVTAGALETSKTAQSDAFVAKFSFASATTEKTLTTLISDGNPQNKGVKVTFTAYVQTESGAIPTGSVKFTLPSGTVTATLDSTGHATCFTTSLPEGAHVITAAYSGSKSASASSDKLTEVIAGQPAKIVLISGSGQNTSYRQPADNLVVVEVKDASGDPVPNVQVTFGGPQGLFYIPLDSDGLATTGYNGQASVGIYSSLSGVVAGTAKVQGVTSPAFFTLTVTSQTEAPYASPFGGSYTSAQTVTLSDQTAGATIYYTTDGTAPTTASTRYTSPISVSRTVTIKAIAVAGSDGVSDIMTAVYDIPPAAATPTFSVAPGVYATSQTVSISDATAGAAIYYTLDGTTPTTGSPVYTAPLKITKITVVQAIAAAYGYANSALAGAAYIVGPYTPGYSDGLIITIGGRPNNPGDSGNGGPFANALLESPAALSFDSSGDLYLTEPFNYDVRMVSAATGEIARVAGNGTQGFSGDGQQATAAELYVPESTALDAHGNLYIADTGNNVVRMVTASTGVISTVAGHCVVQTNGSCGTGDSGDGGAATGALLDGPFGVAVDAQGNLYIADTGNHVVREVNASTGVISTIAGTLLTPGYSGDGKAATQAKLNYPMNLALDANGNLYIADNGNNVIREVNAKTGIITTVAGDCVAQSGGGCSSGYSGDGGKATAAELDSPRSLAFDSSGNLYIADCFNNVIREVNMATGIITTAAGDGTGAGTGAPGEAGFGGGSYSGDDGFAIQAGLNDPMGIAFAASGDLLIADYWNSIVREVIPPAPDSAARTGSGITPVAR
jgi:sugar lactone lactonase YvrE